MGGRLSESAVWLLSAPQITDIDVNALLPDATTGEQTFQPGRALTMTQDTTQYWTDQTSVLLTSMWGWTPNTWGAIGWTGPQGLARRSNLLTQLSDPFVVVCYVTRNSPTADEELKGKVAGFYLVSHDTGDRNEFTHAKHHALSPDQWQHSLRAIRAFSYVATPRLSVDDLDSSLNDRARSVASKGEILTNPHQIKLLRDTPHKEVRVFSPQGNAA